MHLHLCSRITRVPRFYLVNSSHAKINDLKICIFIVLFCMELYMIWTLWTVYIFIQNYLLTRSSSQTPIKLKLLNLISQVYRFSVAVMTRAYPESSTKRKDLLLLQNVASYMLLACGVVYVVSGVFCIGHLKRARQKKEVSAEQAIKDLEDLERRREELEALLIVDRAAWFVGHCITACCCY